MIKALLILGLLFALFLNISAIVEIMAFNSIRSLAAANIVNCSYWILKSKNEDGVE